MNHVDLSYVPAICENTWKSKFKWRLSLFTAYQALSKIFTLKIKCYLVLGIHAPGITYMIVVETPNYCINVVA